MNKKPHLAWEIYINMETSNESLSLLNLIANDCYKMGQFYYSAKAFDVLERLDPDPEFWEGKRGAAIGVFQMVVAGQENKERLIEVIQMLKNTNNPQVEYFVQVIKKWGKENGFKLWNEQRQAFWIAFWCLHLTHLKILNHGGWYC